MTVGTSATSDSAQSATTRAVRRRTGGQFVGPPPDASLHSLRIDVLFVCTANQCRSPMAEALLRARLAERGIDGVRVRSAGLLPGGAPATDHARSTVPGLDGHVSRTLDADLVADADLVIAMARPHLREAAVLAPGAFDKTFALRDLVRRAEAAGPRAPGEPLAAWVARVAAGRRPADYLADDPADDVADPIGEPLAQYRRTARELDDLLARFVSLAWP